MKPHNSLDNVHFLWIRSYELVSEAKVTQCIDAENTKNENVLGVPRWQWSLPGCGFGVVVHIVHSPMRQHPLLPAAQQERKRSHRMLAV